VPHVLLRSMNRASVSFAPRAVVTATLVSAALCMPLRGYPASLEAYGRLPSLEDVALSPDVSKLAYIRTDANTRVLIIFSLSDHKPVSGLRLKENKVRSSRICW